MMKRFGVSLAVCFAAMIWGSVAHAGPVGSKCSNPNGCTFNIGVGQYSCGKLIAALGDDPPGSHREMNTAKGIFIDEHMQYQEWLMGFVTGYNFAYSSPADDPPSKQVTEIDQAGADLWMRNWCNKNPTKKVFDGASAFINEMRSNAAGQR